MFKRHIASFILAALLCVHSLAAVITRNPTSNTTPDAGQGGAAVTGNINTGHGSTNVAAVDGGNQTKSCIWTGFAASPAGVILTVTLKVDWTENGSLAVNGTNNFRIQYSTNGGGAWTDLLNHTDVTSSTSSSSSVALSLGQDLTQVQVRDRLQVNTVGAGDSASLTTTVSAIRIEVVTQDPQVIWIW